MKSITVFAFESHPVVLEGLREIFSGCEDIALAGAAADQDTAVAAIAWLRPDIVLIEHAPGWRSLARRLADFSEVSGLARPVLWAREPEYLDIQAALGAGVRGVLGRRHPVQALIECLRTVASGRVWVAPSAIDRFSTFAGVPAAVQ